MVTAMAKINKDDLKIGVTFTSCKKCDRVEVVHGHWIKQWCDNNLIGHEYEECSVCGCSMLDTNQFWDSPYCPNCGTRMDGERKE